MKLRWPTISEAVVGFVVSAAIAATAVAITYDSMLFVNHAERAEYNFREDANCGLENPACVYQIPGSRFTGWYRVTGCGYKAFYRCGGNQCGCALSSPIMDESERWP